MSGHRAVRAFIHAAFDSIADDDDTDSGHPDLRVRLADRAIRQINPLFGVISRLIAMAGGRITATEILDLRGQRACETTLRFRRGRPLTPRRMGRRIGDQVGLDAEHRNSFQLGGLSANTWHEGLNRILVGVSMAEGHQRLFGGVLPLDDVGSGDIELAGRFAELIDRVYAASDRLSGPQKIELWVDSIQSCVDSLASVAPGEEWQSSQLARLLSDIVDEATTADVVSQVELGLGDVRSILGDRLRGRPSRANFRTGT